MDDIKRMMFDCYSAVLPMVYEDTLTTIETQKKLVKKMNEIVCKMNIIGEAFSKIKITEMVNEYAQEYFESDVYKKTLSSLINESVNNATNEIKEDTFDSMCVISGNIEKLFSMINALVLNNGSDSAEVSVAHKSAYNNNLFNSLNERLNYDYNLTPHINDYTNISTPIEIQENDTTVPTQFPCLKRGIKFNETNNTFETSDRYDCYIFECESNKRFNVKNCKLLYSHILAFIPLNENMQSLITSPQNKIEYHYKVACGVAYTPINTKYMVMNVLNEIGSPIVTYIDEPFKQGEGLNTVEKINVDFQDYSMVYNNTNGSINGRLISKNNEKMCCYGTYCLTPNKKYILNYIDMDIQFDNTAYAFITDSNLNILSTIVGGMFKNNAFVFNSTDDMKYIFINANYNRNKLQFGEISDSNYVCSPIEIGNALSYGKNKINLGDISPDGMFNYRLSKNMFDKRKITEHSYLTFVNIYHTTTDETEGYYLRYVTDFIKVDENTDYIWSKNGASLSVDVVCYYDSNLKFISGEKEKHTFNTPNNCAYIRCTILNSYGTDLVQLERGTLITQYERCGYIVLMDGENTGEGSIKPINIDKKYYNSLFNIYAISTNSFKIPYENVCSLPYNISITTNGKDFVDKNGAIITVNGNDDSQLMVSVYDQNYSIVETRSVPIYNRTLKLKDCSCLVIGDSTIAGGTETQKMLDFFAENGASLKLIGTLGGGSNKHEGRGGWKAIKYCTTEEGNPFYNDGTFDFSYYMQNIGENSVDYVIIQLGINDVFGFTFENYNFENIIRYWDTMVNSILAYNPSQKIIINIPITPINDIVKFSEYYNLYPRFVFNTNIIRFAQELCNHYAHNENIVLNSTNCTLDNINDMYNGVHPNTQGYNKLGVQNCICLNYLMNK